jgi:hypothetical protein
MTTTELAPPERAAFAFGELAIPREFTILQQGREYILSAGLLVGLVQLSRGYYDIETVIVQLPTAENAQTAVVTARVSIFDPDSGRVLRQAGGIGDANPANVGRMVAPHVLRMAETRATARALRHLLGVGLTALEELDQGGAEPGAEVRNPTPAPRAPSGPSWGQPAPASAPTPVAGAAEHILIAGKPYSRAEVLAIYAKRRDEAKAAGLAMGEVEGLAPEHAPLSTLVGKSQELKRRMEAKASANASAK